MTCHYGEVPAGAETSPVSQGRLTVDMKGKHYIPVLRPPEQLL